MKSRERWQTLPCRTRPMHFGSRGPSHQRNALTEKAWENAAQRLSKAIHTF